VAAGKASKQVSKGKKKGDNGNFVRLGESYTKAERKICLASIVMVCF